jgi:hypothetical protein
MGVWQALPAQAEGNAQTDLDAAGFRVLAAARAERAAFDEWAEYMEREIEHIGRGSLVGLGGK